MRAPLPDRFGQVQQLTSSSSISMPRVIRANVSLLSERAKQSATEASRPPNALSWPALSTVAEAAVSF
ncbi:hypothetical protein ABZ468_38485 [Streptomyces sp. NPDC005708]|uniref:hypothetical protein n=1 Tax=Streptomyces sp. NPDC005708 TaxID=3154564 RepID=UPI0033C781C8